MVSILQVTDFSFPIPVQVAAGHRTWHLSPLAVWQAQAARDLYEPEGFAVERFIHCTDDLEE
ncbi:MAG: hypothetical protein AB7V46_19110, partial [Thermomicrobiales bacterium]